MAERKFKKLEASEAVKLDKPGMAVEGTFIGSRAVDTAVGESTLHELDTEGGRKGVWGSALLNDLLSRVEPGAYVRITFTGTKPAQKAGHNPVRLYTVEVAE